MPTKYSRGSEIPGDYDEKMRVALLAHGENPTAETLAELVRLYEQGSGYRGGCGACRNSRKLFIDGLAAIASGDREGGMAKVRGGFSGVGFKIGRLAKILGGG